jgi:predicted lipoprotein with Yx(FWY)xxD motif
MPGYPRNLLEVPVSLPSRPARLLGALVMLALIVAACGDDDDEATTATSVPPTGTERGGAYDTPGAAETTAASQDQATVEVIDSDLGQILASGGRTLYLFMPDNAGSPTCYDDCAATWPPLLADGEVAVDEGLDGSLFATAPRDDGGEQVTVDGWPLYFFASDATPGDHNGHGVGGVWFAVGPDGVPIS